MQQNSNRSLPCRIRNTPRSLGLALLAVPVAATLGAFELTAMASSPPTPHTTTTLVSARQPANPLVPAVDPGPAGEPAHCTGKPGNGLSKELQAFFKAGYSYDDAVLLARFWGQRTTPDDAKTRAGDKLLHHIALPTKPGQTAWTVGDDVAVQAYFDNGYDYADAQELAKLWKSASPADAKATAGHKLLAGLALPLK